MKKKGILLLTIAAAILLSLCVLCAHSILLGGADLPAQEREAILSQAKGIYSDRLWLVPVFVSVEKVEAQRVYYTVRYFPFGSVGMSFGEADGYNIEKPLTRW